MDLIRESVRLVMQELIELEASEQIGAARYERTDTRTTQRNGHRARILSTAAGDLELRIPKLAMPDVKLGFRALLSAGGRWPIAGCWG